MKNEYFNFLLHQLRAENRYLLFVHQIENLAPGIYLLSEALQLVSDGNMQSLAQNCGCGQEIAGKGYFAVAFFGNLSKNYRDEHVEAGRSGHQLYVAVEHLRTQYGVEIRASGIGCFVDALFEEMGFGEPVLYMLSVGVERV